ncbi:MAG: dATP pyrophosphohydrolase [Pseudomonadota bacterium]
MPVRIEEATTPEARRAFAEAPNTLYAHEPNHPQPLTRKVLEALDPDVNPFFRHGSARLFLARRDGDVVGRISAQVSQKHLDRYQDRTGHFGFLAAEDDAETVSALFAAAERWLKQRGMEASTGPFNFTLNDECGLLVDGFEHRPMMMLPFDPEYMGAHLAANGYAKMKDLYTYRFTTSDQNTVERLDRLLQKLPEIQGLQVRKVRLNDFEAEAKILFSVFNDAWADNWGFVPFDDAEIQHLASSLKPIVIPELIWIAEIDGQPIATISGVQDLNAALDGIGPQPSPLGWLRLLWRLKMRAEPDVRIIIAGVSRRFQTTLGRARMRIFAELARMIFVSNLGPKGRNVDAGWMLEDNAEILGTMKLFGARPLLTHRLFEKRIERTP